MDHPIVWTYSSKWTVIHWTAYVTLIWTIQMDKAPLDAYVTSICTVQMDKGPMNRLYYVNLNQPSMLRPFRPSIGRQSIGPPIIHYFGPSKITVVDCNFGLFKITVVDRNFKPSKNITVDRNFEPSQITVLDWNF